jgi:hypothetical protein
MPALGPVAPFCDESEESQLILASMEAGMSASAAISSADRVA